MDTDVVQPISLPFKKRLEDRGIRVDRACSSPTVPISLLNMKLKNPLSNTQQGHDVLTTPPQKGDSSNVSAPSQIESPATNPPTNNLSIKCFSSDGRCIRLYYRDMPTTDLLQQYVSSDFEIDENENKLKLHYIDSDEDKVLLTKRTTISELITFAKSLFVTIIPIKQEKNNIENDNN